MDTVSISVNATSLGRTIEIDVALNTTIGALKELMQSTYDGGPLCGQRFVRSVSEILEILSPRPAGRRLPLCAAPRTDRELTARPSPREPLRARLLHLCPSRFWRGKF
jgi:hypothetical protein